MKKRVVIRALTLACLAWPCIESTTFIRGNGSALGETFSTAVSAEVFDRASGTLYVGLLSATDSFAISKIGRFSQSWPQFSGISAASGIVAECLALIQTQGKPATVIAGVQPSTVTQVFAVPLNSASTTSPSVTLFDADATNTLNAPGATTSGIISLAANSKFIFASVGPNGGTFGQDGSGVAVVSLVYNTTGGIPQLASLVQTAAVAGDMGIKAQKVDPTSVEVFFNATTGLNSPGTMFNTCRLYWDDPLQRLYIGLDVTANTNANDGARSVVVARVNANGVLTLSPICPISALTSEPIAAQANIVAGVQSTVTSTNTPELTLTVDDLRVMHASTGPSYLIVNGGNFDSPPGTPIIESKIFALPLVDLTQPDGTISNAAIHGTLANKNSALVNGKFVVAATAPADLVEDPTISGTDTFALVGGAPLPIDQTTDIGPSDIVVIDDTVYISLNVPQSNFTESGILYSQARFDATGKIVGWTPWSKRGFPFYGLPGTMNQERVAFFDVDAVTGNIWAIGSDTTQAVAVTQWDRGSNGSSLATKLNQAAPFGSTAVLDLDAFTRGFDGNTAFRYAVFGCAACHNTSAVVFALISQSRNGTESQAPQTVTTDFSLPENFLVTNLPRSAGYITSLEYSRTAPVGTNPQANYFFAGTINGLYVFPVGLANTFSTLNAAPFSTSQWEKAAHINGSIIDIKTLGNTLYVLASTTSKSQPLSTILYSIPYTSSTATMFAPANIFVIAQTGGGSFGSVQQFTSIQLIATSPDSSTEQVVLATNRGLFRTSTVGGSQTATSDATASWESIDTTSSTVYSAIAGMDAASAFISAPVSYFIGAPSTVWPINIQDQATKTFSRSSIQQLNGTTDTGPYTFEPTNFNGNVPTQAFTSLPATTAFWSDGSRRFFIIRQPFASQNINRLMVSPYGAQAWGVTNPAQNIVSSPLLATVNSFNWVKQIGASGILMAGTNSGVAALE